VTNIFIGNLDSNASEEQLRILFAAYGAVETVTIVKDRDTSEPRGFAFVEMTQAAEAQAAISSLDGALLNERSLRVVKLVQNCTVTRGATRGAEITGVIKSELRTSRPSTLPSAPGSLLGKLPTESL